MTNQSSDELNWLITIFKIAYFICQRRSFHYSVAFYVIILNILIIFAFIFLIETIDNNFTFYSSKTIFKWRINMPDQQNIHHLYKRLL